METLENEYVKFSIRDGILFCVYKGGFVIDLKVAEEIVAARHELVQGKCYAGVFDCRNLLELNRDARKYFAEEKAIKGIIAGAFVFKSQFQKVILNFFLQINRPAVPSMIFTSLDEAAEWAKSMIPEDLTLREVKS